MYEQNFFKRLLHLSHMATANDIVKPIEKPEEEAAAAPEEEAAAPEEEAAAPEEEAAAPEEEAAAPEEETAAPEEEAAAPEEEAADAFAALELLDMPQSSVAIDFTDACATSEAANQTAIWQPLQGANGADPVGQDAADDGLPSRPMRTKKPKRITRAQRRAAKIATQNDPHVRRERMVQKEAKRLATSRARVGACIFGGLAALCFFTLCLIMLADNFSLEAFSLWLGEGAAWLAQWFKAQF